MHDYSGIIFVSLVVGIVAAAWIGAYISHRRYLRLPLRDQVRHDIQSIRTTYAHAAEGRYAYLHRRASQYCLELARRLDRDVAQVQSIARGSRSLDAAADAILALPRIA